MKKIVIALLVSFGIHFIVSQWNDARLHAGNWSISADAMILLDADTGDVLYEKNSKKSLPIASMTKLMTQYIVLNTIKNGTLTWDTVYQPSANVVQLANYASASKLGIKANQNYTVRELFTAMTVISANDAALALAELVAGSEEQFVSIMNEQAKVFKMKQTTFYNPHGLDGGYLGRSEAHTNMASAHDMAILGDRLIQKHPDVLDFAKLQSFTSRQGTKMWTTNLLLPGMRIGMAGMDGLKTGYTDAAGPCFAGTGVFNGRRVISVVMGVEEVDGDRIYPRFTLTRELVERFAK